MKALRSLRLQKNYIKNHRQPFCTLNKLSIEDVSEYQLAINYLKDSDYKNSLSHLLRMQEILENVNQNGTIDYFTVLNK